MSPLKNLWPFRRKAPRLVVEFRREKDGEGVHVKVSAVGTEKARDQERRAMAVFLLAIEKGAFQLSHEKRVDGFPYGGMDALWKNALTLGWVLLHEKEGLP